MNDRDSDSDIYKTIGEGISFRGANLWVLIFAIFIASLGLNINSTAVIIGAMLISPLMGPIIGIGLSVGINDFDLLKKSLINYIVATIISVLTAALFFLISPYSGVKSELLARTSPTLYDVLIALFGGAAGIVALSKGGKGNVIPGVAIATAIMPPLCTAGYGIAHLSAKFFLGAIYLYFINCVFIAVATYIGTRMMKFKHVHFIEEKSYKRVRKYIIGIVALTIIPAIFMTIKIVRDGYFNSNVSNFVSSQIKYPGTQIISQTANKTNKILEIVAVGREIPQKTINEAEAFLERYKLKGYKLQVIQGSQSDSLLKLNSELISLTTSSSQKDITIHEQATEIAELEKRVNYLQRYDKLGSELIGEINIFLKQVNSITLSNVIENLSDGSKKNFIQAVITLKGNSTLNSDDLSKLQELIKKRCNEDASIGEKLEVRVVVLD